MDNQSIKTIARSIGFLAAAFAVGAHAAPASAEKSTAEQRYQQERARCLDGSSHQDRETCLKEAVNARAEARKNPDTATPEEWQRNALARCERVAAADKEACERLAKGQGRQSGSVEGGGVIKEIVTQTSGPTLKVVPVVPK